MFHSVRIFSPDGKIKKIVGSSELSVRHWKNFVASESEMNLTTAGQLRTPSWMKKKLEMEYPEYTDATCYY